MSMEQETEEIKVGITLGDVNGIGPEVVLKALDDSRILSEFTPVVYGSTKLLSHVKRAAGLDQVNWLGCQDATDAKRKKLNVVQVWSDEFEPQWGQKTAEGGSYSLKSLEAAVQDLTTNKIDVLVTAPISKETIAKAGFAFAGHTEYLADKAGAEPLMMMVADELRVALVTTHCALKEVSGMLIKDLILNKIRLVQQSLVKDFGCVKPRIAVLGLNPHAGENGKMGSEEQEVITPAINQAQQEGLMVFGPYPADGFFGSEARGKFDAVLAMYHDQGLTPFKALAFDQGVNYTAGLPIVRTSPDHGTAFDIAGEDKASADSMRQAIYLAVDIYRQRKAFKIMHANPLPFSPPDKKKSGKDLH